MEITHSNNSPNKIALFLRQNSFRIGCPVELITDLGTENGLAAAMQSFFLDNPEGFETNLLLKSFNKFFSHHGLIVEKYGAALREMRLAIQA